MEKIEINSEDLIPKTSHPGCLTENSELGKGRSPLKGLETYLCPINYTGNVGI